MLEYGVVEDNPVDFSNKSTCAQSETLTDHLSSAHSINRGHEYWRSFLLRTRLRVSPHLTCSQKDSAVELNRERGLGIV